ncbi:MAG: hypothetical protein K9J16_07790 [Melioribacteraceae bacterium]|nr:hypothetical protein [Melioribacteraceae bacterium]MCF8353332.1 hypothetical protein [Melioribacteraceae bacterium]MCF8393196.1 hypothetical protein [Melioribacteraceae bacterium]MCF8419058.1 hypothetical protein [Melioribacteraceae bacterium]
MNKSIAGTLLVFYVLLVGVISFHSHQINLNSGNRISISSFDDTGNSGHKFSALTCPIIQQSSIISNLFFEDAHQAIVTNDVVVFKSSTNQYYLSEHFINLSLRGPPEKA